MSCFSIPFIQEEVKMKKILVLALSLIMLVSLPGCGRSADEGAAAAPAQAAKVQSTEATAAPTEQPQLSTEDILTSEEWVSHDSSWRLTWKADGTGTATNKYSGKQMSVFDWSVARDSSIELITPSDKIIDLTLELKNEGDHTLLVAEEQGFIFVRVSEYEKSEYDRAYERLTFYEQSFIRRNALLLKVHYGDAFSPDDLRIYSIEENDKGVMVVVSDGGPLEQLRIDMGVSGGTIYSVKNNSLSPDTPYEGMYDLDAVNAAIRLYFQEKSAQSIAE